MPLWQWVLDIFAAAVAAILLYGVLLVLRRWWLSRGGGTFELSHRPSREASGRGWILGIGRYTDTALEWYRIFSLVPRAKRSWRREDLAYVGRREPEGVEQMSLFPEHIIAILNVQGETVEVAMSPESLTGFQAWIEAGPPGATFGL